MQEDVLREALISLLKDENAHANIESALKDITPDIINKHAGKNTHTIWQLLEHMRITQEDIIRYTIDTSWKSPQWPEGYWPKDEDNATKEQWDHSVKRFFKDLDETVELIKNVNIDLTSQIPGGEGRTYLREILLIADHNSYHISQIILTRKLLGSWH
ncbi:MAG: DinB family protein [Bacillota bacterium]